MHLYLQRQNLANIMKFILYIIYIKIYMYKIIKSIAYTVVVNTYQIIIYQFAYISVIIIHNI